MKFLVFLTCGKLLHSIDSMHLPPLRTVIAEYTDAGPSVGISNNAVRFRCVEKYKLSTLSSFICIKIEKKKNSKHVNEKFNSHKI